MSKCGSDSRQVRDGQTNNSQVSNIESKTQLPERWLYNPRRLLYITPLTVITEKNIARWNELQTREFDISYLFPEKFDLDIYMADAAFCLFNVDKLDTAKHDTIKSTEARTIYGKILEALRRFSDDTNKKNIDMDTFYSSLELLIVVIFMFYKLLIRSCKIRASHIPLKIPFDEKLQNKIFYVESTQKGYIEDITYYATNIRIFVKSLLDKLCISGAADATHRNIVMLYFMFVRSEIGGAEYKSDDYIKALTFTCKMFHYSPRCVMMLFRAYMHENDIDSAIKMLEKYFESEYNTFLADRYVKVLRVYDRTKIIPFLTKYIGKSMYSTFRFCTYMIAELYEKINANPFGTNNFKKPEIMQLAEIPHLLRTLYENITKATGKEHIDLLPYQVEYVIVLCMLFGLDGIVDIKIDFDVVATAKKDYDGPHLNIVLALLHHRAKDHEKALEYFNLAAKHGCNVNEYRSMYDINLW